MPPIPVMVVLSIVGLFVYVAIGAGLASLFCTDRGDVAKRAERVSKGNGSEWTPFWWFTVLWPVAMAGIIAVGAIVGLLYGPFWIARGIGRYVADARVGKKPEPKVVIETISTTTGGIHA